MDKNKLKLWVDIGMGLAFLIVVLTGIFKWPGLSQTIFSGIFNYVSFRAMSRIHDWSGAIMALFVLIHLTLNWIWIKSMILCTFRKKEKCEVAHE